MSEWKEQPVDNEQFNKVVHAHAQVIETCATGIVKALERNTKALLAVAMMTGQIATGSINRDTTVEQLERLLSEHLKRDY